MKKIVAIVVFCVFVQVTWAQTGTLFGTLSVSDARETTITLSILSTNIEKKVKPNTRYELENIPFGQYVLIVKRDGSKPIRYDVRINTVKKRFDLHLNFKRVKKLRRLVITEKQDSLNDRHSKNGVNDFAIFEGKKNEIVLLDNLVANKAANNPRQIYGTVTGLNIWESDYAGLQLDIGGRGLNPSRTSNFNTRQNGYDISADALGYPESYYTPPADALKEIEVTRGAAALQYGTQFGGAVNFKFRDGAEDKMIQYRGKQSIGSYEYISSYNELSGVIKKGWQYFTFYQKRKGKGWRENSSLDANNYFARLAYKGNYSKFNVEFTHLDYLSQQAGGLTDALFKEDPRQSVRARNWFSVNWNLLSVSGTYKFTSSFKLNLRTFGLIANRKSLGILDRINVTDFGQHRLLIDGTFRNIGGELRLHKKYKFKGHRNDLVAGIRVYQGNTFSRQGDADNGDNANFIFINEDYPENFEYKYPNKNVAVFVEHIFRFGRLSITPGLRFEYINTQADGYYRERSFDFAGNLIADIRNDENITRQRQFAIAGLGARYTINERIKLLANISQNYRAINFSDLRVQNPNFVIDSNIQDERGFTADLTLKIDDDRAFKLETTLFYIHYNNRIGQILQANVPPLYLDYRFRTNVSASRNMGIESFIAYNWNQLLKWKKFNWTTYTNISLIDARYVNSKDKTIEGNLVEMVPPVVVRIGSKIQRNRWKIGIQYNYTAEHYSDATNARYTSSAIEGLIPAYKVFDLSAAYKFSDRFSLEGSCNNVLNELYFTRRAPSYPGPGIIPASPRLFFLTLGLTF